MVFLRRCNLFSVPDDPRDTVALLFTCIEMNNVFFLCKKNFLLAYSFRFSFLAYGAQKKFFSVIASLSCFDVS